MFILNRNKILLGMIHSYFDICNNSMEILNNAISHYLSSGNDMEFEQIMRTALDNEFKADEILFDIEKLLYQKSLLPESREDIIRLLAKYDDIIDCSVHVLRYFHTRSMIIPVTCNENITALLQQSLLCYEQVRLGIEDLFAKRNNILGFVRQIKNYESQCDEIQATIIKELFLTPIEPYSKILISDLVNLIAKLSDLCEDAADLITLINIKRVV